MSTRSDTRIYELFNRDHTWFLDELFRGQHADTFFDISREMEIVFDTDATWTMFRLAFGGSCDPGLYEQQLPSLRTSLGCRQMVDDVINQLNMSNTAVLVERVRLVCPDGRDHDRLHAALDAADPGAARSFSI